MSADRSTVVREAFVLPAAPPTPNTDSAPGPSAEYWRADDNELAARLQKEWLALQDQQRTRAEHARRHPLVHFTRPAPRLAVYSCLAGEFKDLVEFFALWLLADGTAVCGMDRGEADLKLRAARRTYFRVVYSGPCLTLSAAARPNWSSRPRGH